MNVATHGSSGADVAPTCNYTKIHDPRAVANYFITKILSSDTSLNSEQKVTPLSLQKLIYIANALHLSEYDTPLVSEQPRLGRYDPYFPTLREVLSFFGGITISKKITDGSGEEVYFADDKLAPIEAEFTPSQVAMMDELWDTFASLSFDCTRLTYLTGGANEEFAELQSLVDADSEIPNNLIKEMFMRKLVDVDGWDEINGTRKCTA